MKRNIFSDSKLILFVVYLAIHPSAYCLVHSTNSLYEAEEDARNARMEMSKLALQTMTGRELSPQQIPVIGIAGSGGGVRAASALLGLLLGLDACKLGRNVTFSLLDAVAYIAGISGATWTMAAWYAHQMSLNNLASYLANQLDCSFKEMIPFEAISSIRRFENTHQRSFDLTDLWGCLIGKRFLGSENTITMKLSDFTDPALEGTLPIPIFTALLGKNDGSAMDYQWAEFTPFAVNSPYLGQWIHPDDFGKCFDNARTTDQYPGKRLSYILALCGAAYAVNPRDIFHAITGSISGRIERQLSDSWFAWLSRFSIGHIRFMPPQYLTLLRE